MQFKSRRRLSFTDLFFFFFLVRVLILPHFPFSPNESNREGSVIIFHTAAGRGLTAGRDAASAFFFCRGQRGETRDPTAAPTKHPSPFLPPRHPRSPSLQHCSGITCCTKPPVSSDWGSPNAIWAPARGYSWSCLAASAFKEAAHTRVQSHFAIGSAWLVASGTPAGSGVRRGQLCLVPPWFRTLHSCSATDLDGKDAPRRDLQSHRKKNPLPIRCDTYFI